MTDMKFLDGHLRRPTVVAEWQASFDALYAIYVASFFDDPLFNCAMLLDVRNHGGLVLTDEKEMEISRDTEHQISKAKAMLCDMVNDECIRQLKKQQEKAAKEQNIAEGSYEERADFFFRNKFNIHEVEAIHVNDATIEMARFMLLVRDLWKKNCITDRTDPIDVFRSGEGMKLNLIKAVALRVLSVPVGEAPSERIFSISSRIIRKERASMCANIVAQLTFLKKEQECAGDARPCSVLLPCCRALDCGGEYEIL